MTKQQQNINVVQTSLLELLEIETSILDLANSNGNEKLAAATSKSVAQLKERAVKHNRFIKNNPGFESSYKGLSLADSVEETQNKFSNELQTFYLKTSLREFLHKIKNRIALYEKIGYSTDELKLVVSTELYFVIINAYDNSRTIEIINDNNSPFRKVNICGVSVEIGNDQLRENESFSLKRNKKEN